MHRTVGIIGYFGAMGTFDPPAASIQIFDVPATTSPQYAQFAADFPAAAKSKYAGFVSPDRERFYRSYGMGFRVSSYSGYAAPGMYSFTMGQDEAITGGVFRSVVGRFDVFLSAAPPFQQHEQVQVRVPIWDGQPEVRQGKIPEYVRAAEPEHRRERQRGLHTGARVRPESRTRNGAEHAGYLSH